MKGKQTNDPKTRFGNKPGNLGININEVRPLSKCVRPKHPVKVEIRPGLTVYTSRGKSIAAVRKKFAGK